MCECMVEKLEKGVECEGFIPLALFYSRPYVPHLMVLIHHTLPYLPLTPSTHLGTSFALAAVFITYHE